MREESMLARIHEAENSQYVAELTQKISQLEMKVRLQFRFELTFFRLDRDRIPPGFTSRWNRSHRGRMKLDSMPSHGRMGCGELNPPRMTRRNRFIRQPLSWETRIQFRVHLAQRNPWPTIMEWATSGLHSNVSFLSLWVVDRTK